MIEKNDWRLQGQERYLTGRKLVKIPYFRWSKIWDHEHCDFCGATFSACEGDLKEGYVTAEDKRIWVCPQCFRDFREMFGWQVVDPADT